MQDEFLILLKLFDEILDNFLIIIHEENPDYIHSLNIQRRFFKIHMKFDELAESIEQEWNYLDYIKAIEIVKDRGYVSIAELSRKLNIIYRLSFQLVLKMESEGIILKPDKGIRKYNFEND